MPLPSSAACTDTPAACLPSGQVLAVAKLGVAVIGTFALCWAPYLASLEDTLQVGGQRAAAAAGHMLLGPMSTTACAMPPCSTLL